MNKYLEIAALLLVCCIGLHLPRSYALFYLFALIIWVLGSCSVDISVFMKSQEACRLVRNATLLLVLFSIAYVSGMVWWGFWELPIDALDAVNALCLPALLFGAGMRAVSLKRAGCTRILLAYAIGGLLYGCAALLVAREPWWNVAQTFPLSIQVAWGSSGLINVRSVEQTAYPALLLLAPSLLLVTSNSSAAKRRFGMLLIAIGALGAHVVWSLNGRLGWLALVLAITPIVYQLCVKPVIRLSRDFQGAFPVAVFAVVLAFTALGLRRFHAPSSIRSIGWGQGLCDERISFFSSMLMRLHHAPWGGRTLKVPYSLCGEDSLSGLLAAHGGTVVMAHNVILEIYFSVGWLPALLLSIYALPCLWIVLRAFGSAFPRWDWQAALRWGWLCFLSCQWLFQPLLYSDGILYYLSFFVFGLFVAESLAGVSAFDCGRRAAKIDRCEEYV